MKIVMLKGLPSSGKTTWAKEQQNSGGNYMVISRDEIRKMFGGYKVSREKEVIRTRNELIRLGVKLKKNIIVDDTNLSPKHEQYLRQLAKELNVKFQVNDSFLEVSPEECIKRDLDRGEKAIGAATIWEMYYTYCASKNPILDKNNDKPRAIICDLDGTLAVNTEGRSYYDMNRVGEDDVDPFVGCIVDALFNYGVERDDSPYPTVILLSGRSEKAREGTTEWLDRNLIPYDELYLRDPNDNRRDEIVKEEMYHKYIEPKYAVLGVFEDRPRCARMWRKLGLSVLQAGIPELEF